MSFLTEAEKIGLEIVEAALQGVTGVAAPGAPATRSSVATVAGQVITFGQLVATAKAVSGSKIGDKLHALIANIGDVDNDFDVAQQIFSYFAPDIPIAGEIATLLFVLHLAYDGARMLYAANPAAFAQAPRGGPPIAEADWSKGWPQPQPVDNPSGAIGGASS